MASAAVKAPFPAEDEPTPEPDAPPGADPVSFVRTFSHELRTPLNAIIGFSELIVSEMYGPLGAPQYQEYAEIIHASGHRLLKLVNQLVEAARLQAEEELEPGYRRLGLVLQEMAERPETGCRLEGRTDGVEDIAAGRHRP